jgi:hypothetical protein
VTDAELQAARAWYERYRDWGDTAFFLAHVPHYLPALLEEVALLRRMLDGLAARVAAQSEFLSRRAEGPTTPPA